jgi:hypothetical protein
MAITNTSRSSLACRIVPGDPLLLALVESTALATARPERPLYLQALLQLPRLADAYGCAEIAEAEGLLEELAQELPVESEWLVSDVASPRFLHFGELRPACANDVMQRFHYLRSPRTDGRAYGLSTAGGRLVALCVSSPLDVAHLEELLTAAGRLPESARCISRVFAFEGAPVNCISYLLSRVGKAERRLGVTDFVTYVNPNMGFTGISYRASGWQLLGDEPGTRYRYLDGRYTTDRRLASLFGERDDLSYSRLLGRRFAISTSPLAPLRVFHKRLM